MEVSDLTVSVSRNDSLVTLPPLEESTWRKQVTATPGTFSGKWIPEYEGHIICGQIESPTGETLKQVQNEPISADIAFVGKDIRYVQGQSGIGRKYTVLHKPCIWNERCSSHCMEH